MNVVKRIIDSGTNPQTPIYNRNIRFTNSVALIVCIFIIQNALFAIYYHQPIIAAVHAAHFVVTALVPFFNGAGKRVLASAWFSTFAILFVTFLAICFTLDSYTFVFLSQINFLLFFLFPFSEKKYIFSFTVMIIACFGITIAWQELNLPPIVAVPKALIETERWSSLSGIAFLSIAFGLYASLTVHDAEQEATKEKEKSELLLHNILPEAIARRFKSDRSFFAEEYSSATVLFADIVDFTSLSGKVTPDELVRFLDAVFSKFDDITESFGLEKIKTIGDAYMVAGGVPGRMDDHAPKVCRMALKMLEAVREIENPLGQPLYLRIGINTGPVTAGVIGVKKLIYDLWGDTVNTASRMESHAEINSIQVTEELYELLKNEFDFQPRGLIMIKGKGLMNTYCLIGEKPAVAKSDIGPSLMEAPSIEASASSQQLKASAS